MGKFELNQEGRVLANRRLIYDDEEGPEEEEGNKSTKSHFL